MQLVKVIRLPRSKVHLGAPLLWNVRDEGGKLLLSRGHMLVDERQLNELLERGAFVDVEEVRASAEEAQPPEKKVVPPPNLFGAWDKEAQALRELCQHPDVHHDFLNQLKSFAERLLTLMDANTDVSLYRTVRQENQPLFYYGYNHAIHTAVLGVLLTRHLGWSAQRTMSMLLAALTMNLPILDLQGQMAAQDVPIKDRQKAEIQAHPEKAVALLTACGVSDSEWLKAIMEHHEHGDGSGYPSGRTTLSEMAIALRVTDVFMAKISPRVVRDALTPQEAIKQLYREDQGGPISTAVIKQFGIYPPGDFVKLATGELGIVVQRTS